MDEAVIERLMATLGADFPPVARALADLPDTHPLKVQALETKVIEQAAIAGQVDLSTAEDTSTRLSDVEARLSALETLADVATA